VCGVIDQDAAGLVVVALTRVAGTDWPTVLRGGERRRRAVIQLASSLRNLGQAQESVGLLTAELAAGSDHLDDAVRAFLALALVDVGREREAASLALAALAPHLPRYQRSLGNYAKLLVEPEPS
jgi:Tetratrico peptide repeat